LIDQGRVTSFPEREVLIAEILIKEYIKYPFPENSSFPYNYCALDKIAGNWIKPILNLIC